MSCHPLINKITFSQFCKIRFRHSGIGTGLNLKKKKKKGGVKKNTKKAEREVVCPKNHC